MKNFHSKTCGRSMLAGLAAIAVGSTQSGLAAVTVYAQPVVSSGSSGTCPGKFSGYINYTKSSTNGWGWALSTNTTTFQATDGGGRTDVKVEFLGQFGDTGCNHTTVTLPNPPSSPVYRFNIYFTNTVPATNYPLVLTGFDP
jgi:hypothetical protein